MFLSDTVVIIIIYCESFPSRRCFFTTESLQMKHTFLKEIRQTFGSGGFVCSFNEKELAEFHHFLECGFLFNNPSKVKKGIQWVGNQDGALWLLNQSVHINANGDLIPVDQSPYSWQPIGGPTIELMGKSNTAGKFSLECDIQVPLESSSCLHNLLQRMQPVFKHNYMAGEFMFLEVISLSSHSVKWVKELGIDTINQCGGSAHYCHLYSQSLVN